MSINTNSRGLVTEIPGQISEINLYKNQRATVLMSDIFDLNNSVNKLLKTELQDNVISIKEINEKLTSADFVDNLNLQTKKIDTLLTPRDFNTADNYFEVTTDLADDYIGMSAVKIAGVAVAEDLDIQLAQKDLNENSTAFSTDLASDSAFGPKIKITPVLSSIEKQITLDKPVISTQMDYQTADNLTIIRMSVDGSSTNTTITAPDDILGYTSINCAAQISSADPIEIKLQQELTAAEVLAKIKDNQTDNIIDVKLKEGTVGIERLSLPPSEGSLDLTESTGIKIDTSNNFKDSYVADITGNTTAESTAYYEIIPSDNNLTTLTRDAAQNKCGFTSVTAINTIPTYKVNIKELPTYKHSSFELSDFTVPLTADIPTNLSAIRWGFNSTDIKRALQVIAAPKVIYSDLTINSTAFEKQRERTTDKSTIEINAPANVYFNKVTLTIPASDIVVDKANLMLLNFVNNTTIVPTFTSALTEGYSDTDSEGEPTNEPGIEYNTLSLVDNTDTCALYMYNNTAKTSAIYWQLQDVLASTNYVLNVYQCTKSNATMDEADKLLSINFNIESDADMKLIFNPNSGRTTLQIVNTDINGTFTGTPYNNGEEVTDDIESEENCAIYTTEAALSELKPNYFVFELQTVN